MKLKSIQIFPKGKEGWSSGEISFSDHITQLYGPNGTGKSPLLQSIIHCFGLSTKFRKNIYENCSKAKLILESNGKEIYLERSYSKEFYLKVVELIDDVEFIHEFYSEGQVSDYLFTLLGFNNRSLVTNSKSQTQIYLSTIIPFYYADQNSGYSSIYATDKKFVKDQFSEMVRFLFKLPEKNSFDKKKSKLKVEKELEYWHKVVIDRKTELTIIKDSIAGEVRSVKVLNDVVEKLCFELDLAKNNAMDESEVDESFNFIINSMSKQVRDIDREMFLINQKLTSVDSIVAEIEDEVSTLNLNEEARRVFLDFGEICANSGNGCGLFSRSNDTYSKSLLYLKDQIKDLKRNKTLDNERRESLLNSKTFIKKEIDSVIKNRNDAFDGTKNSSSIALLNELERKVFEAKSELSDVLKTEEYEKRYIEALNSQEATQAKVNSFGRDNEKLTDLVKTRVQLTENLVKWLSVLQTRNVSFDIGYVNDFEPVFDGESIQSLSGSTKIRVLLAYHAALIEAVLSKNGDSLPFLVFDTPKQHEIDSEDLDAFFQELKKLCRKFGIQVVFSTSEYHYVGDDIDIEYLPQYEGQSQKMYLKDPRFNQ
jgi:ABC-type cobalamin transport system ATPase subunit